MCSFPTIPTWCRSCSPRRSAPVQGKEGRPTLPRDLLENARRISDPAERSLALRQIANGAIASNQLVLAHHTLEESISASSHVNVPLVRDQRLIGLVTSMTALTDALLRVARENQSAMAADQETEAAGLDPLPKRQEDTVLIRLARLEWRRAVYLAEIMATRRTAMRCSTASRKARPWAFVHGQGLRPGSTSNRWGIGRLLQRRCRGSRHHNRLPCLRDRLQRLRRPPRPHPPRPRGRLISTSWPTTSWSMPGRSPTGSTG